MVQIHVSRMRKGMNKAAFGGNLHCPVCRSRAVRFVENVGPYRLRYRCRKCGMPFQYETGHDMGIHPYAAFNKNKFRDIVEGNVTPKEYLKGRKK